MTQKTIVLSWQQVYSNMPQDDRKNFWGIGDLLRGTVACYQICKRYNIKLVVDTHKHPIGQCLKNNTTEFSDKLDELGENVHFVTPEWIIQHIELHLINADADTIFLMTNAQCHMPLNEEDKNFLKCLLEPNDEMNHLIQEYNVLLPNNYSVQHYRLGDDELLRKQNVKDKHKSILGWVLHNYEETDILFSDSKIFKDYVNSKMKIATLDTEIGHVGYHKDMDKIKFTMLDFFIISKAKVIKTYSVYNWGSGFVKWISNIFDIPLIITNPKFKS